MKLFFLCKLKKTWKYIVFMIFSTNKLLWKRKSKRLVFIILYSIIDIGWKLESKLNYVSEKFVLKHLRFISNNIFKFKTGNKWFWINHKRFCSRKSVSYVSYNPTGLNYNVFKDILGTYSFLFLFDPISYRSFFITTYYSFLICDVRNNPNCIIFWCKWSLLRQNTLKFVTCVLST